MGLRFRKSISIIPGVRLNLGKTGVSVSAGVPGFRKTIHSSGRTTTSVGIPGTGLYYVDTKNNNTKKSSPKHKNYDNPPSRLNQDYETFSNVSYEQNFDTYDNDKNETIVVSQIDDLTLESIHKTADDTIDWTEVLVYPNAPDEMYNKDMWSYYHSMAPQILKGDIDTYLKLIYEVNPLDDLLAYGSDYEFGTDDPNKIEVEFNVNESALSNAQKHMSALEYNLLLQKYVCSVCIRIARDMFALLPINNVIVHATLNNKTILSVDFDTKKFSQVNFSFVEPLKIVELFRNNMNFNEHNGFLLVDRL